MTFHREYPDDDPLRPFRGVVNGLWMGAIAWVAIVVVAIAIGWVITR